MATNHQFWVPRQNGGGDRPRKVHFSQLWKLRDLDLRSGRGHTGAHMWSRSTHTPNQMEIGKTFCGRTDGRTDTLEFQSTRSSVGDDLMNESWQFGVAPDASGWDSEWISVEVWQKAVVATCGLGDLIVVLLQTRVLDVNVLCWSVNS